MSKRGDDSSELKDELTRRKFLERTATVGGAAVVTGAITRAQNSGGSMSTRAPSMGKMVEYKSDDLTIPVFL